VLGEYCGDVVAEVRRVVEILDVGAVNAEDVANSFGRQNSDDVIDDPIVG
jgi:hypothetical protein